MKKVITIITVIVTVFTFATPASADWIEATSSLTETEFDNLVTDNAVSSALIFRAGGDSGIGSHKLEADSGYEYGVNWNFDSNNDITLNFTEAGVLELSANGSDIVWERPTAWFNTVIISIRNDAGPKRLDDLTFEGININGEGNISLNAPTLNSWDAVRIDLTGYDSENQSPFTLSGNLIPTDGIIPVIADDFRGEIYFLQTEAIPEPNTAYLVVIGLGGGLLYIRRRLSRHRY